MRIAIDISPVVYGTGVSQYTKNLVESLLQIDKRNQYVLFGGSLRKLSEFKKIRGGNNFTVKSFPLPPTLAHFVWNKLHKLPIEGFVGKVDVFHSSDWTQPPSYAFKVTTIHDLVPLRYPKISHSRIVSAHQARLSWVKKEVDKIIAVSEFTKKEIIDLLDIDPKKIIVIPEAPDPSLKRSSEGDIAGVLAKYNINHEYLLCVGSDPRKNIPTVIEAFEKLRKDRDISLVVVGRNSVPNVACVLHLGHVSRQDLACLYSNAQALVYTSLYEGFGLPILEAMQIGCPVVTSNLSSMKEIAGDGAVLVDPRDTKSIIEGVQKVFMDRSAWINRGKRRSKHFSWIDTAEKTLKVYRESQK